MLTEVSYPLDFHRNDAATLGLHLQKRHNVMIVGMKRVGISNFLKFFIYHKDIHKAYLNNQKNHLFIHVELIDLLEKEIQPFWILTFKRIVDKVLDSKINQKIKKEVERVFLDSIESKDLLITIDGIKKCLLKIVEAGFLPTIFFNRFDRIVSASNHDFFSNLEGLNDALDHKLSIVMTSYRSLDSLSPVAFIQPAFSIFCHTMYFKSANIKDVSYILNLYNKLYKLNLTTQIERELFKLTGGHRQYLQFALINLHDSRVKVKSPKELIELLINDERISLQSEELWESLTALEKEVLVKISQKLPLSSAELKSGKYLFLTGMVVNLTIFSKLLENYISQAVIKKIDIISGEFTKKENSLFDLLEKNLDQVVEREKIIETVWPETQDLGVSDWAIDRLVARVRNKLKTKDSPFEIQTIKTRGFKLVKAA